MDLIRKYFPDLNPNQEARFEKLLEIIPELNKKVNVISRKDIGSLEEKHVLHSLSIAKQFQFRSKHRIIDVGTGGGFPGIPLSILFPECQFTLVDSIEKKMGLVKEVIQHLEIQNAGTIRGRMEELNLEAHFVVSRAVTSFPKLHQWTRKLILPGSSHGLANGLISLKGGDLREELKPLGRRVELFPISTWFEESFFSTKMIVYLKK